MISLKELFDKDNILLPEWLLDESVDEEWNESNYSYNGEFHTWTLENIFGTSRICFDGEEYHFQSLSDEGDWIPFKTITKEHVIHY